MNQYVVIPRSDDSATEIRYFEPRVVKISKGQSITWINRDTKVHELTSGDGDSSLATEFFQTGSMLPGESTTVKIDSNQGSIPYYCLKHPAERGLIAISQTDGNQVINTRLGSQEATSLFAAENQKILTRLQRQVDPAIVEYLSDPNAVLIQNKIMTIVFWDISNFSDLSEKLKDHPELIAVFLNEYFAIAIPIIHEYNGIVDKFIGDGILAYFGFTEAGVDGSNGASSAVLAAIKLISSFKAFKANWTDTIKMITNSDIGIDIKCGINTGSVLVGLLGSGVRDQFTVIGTNVNLASRLEGKAEGGQIVLSPYTMEKVKGKFDLKTIQIQDEKIKSFEEITKYYVVG
ncbi:MAG: adenylate/guanylate cyclase domain-containing protein [Candidatus Eiseniibacteriota bacterium]